MKKQKPTMMEHPITFGATIIQIYWSRFKQILGKFLNYLEIPGFVKPTKIFDSLTKTHLEVKIDKFFTVISVNGIDYYFKRLDGKFDGTGMGCDCDD